MLEEHGHVDAVGGEADEEEDGDKDGRFNSVKEELRLKADQIIWVVPWDGLIHAKDDAVFSRTLFADWLTPSTVHGDVISVSATVVSDSMISEKDIAVVN